MKEYWGKKVVKGKAEGPLILIPTSFSFLGDVDMDTSQVIIPCYKEHNLFLKNSILLFKETKGSSGGCVVLMTLARKKIAPLGIITLRTPDYNLTEGAILSGIPYIAEIKGEILDAAKTGDHVEMNADLAKVILNCLE